MPQKFGPSSIYNLTLLSYVKKVEDGPNFCGLLRISDFQIHTNTKKDDFKFNVFLACIMLLLVWSSFRQKIIYVLSVMI